MRGTLMYVAAALVAACAPVPPAPDDTARRVTALADEYVAAYTATFPEVAFARGLVLERHDGLSDNSLAARTAWEDREDAWWARVQSLDGESLWGRPEWITYGFLREALEAQRGLRVCRYELWPLNQLSGWQASFAALAGNQPVGDAAKRVEALARWRQLPRYLDTEIASLREGVRRGYTTPQRNVELTLQQLDGLLATPPGQSPFYGPAARDPDPDFVKAWTAMLDSELKPAFQRYRDYVRDEYRAAARREQAITAHADGVACYRASFRANTSLDRAPEETFAIGREIVGRNEQDIRRLGKQHLGSDDLGTLRERIENDRANRFRNASQVRADAEAAVARAFAALPKWFGRLPRAKLAIEPIPEALAAAASPHYRPAAEDGSRPGTYYIRLHEPAKQLRSRNELIALHEAYPGHHLQIALGQEQPGSHPIARLLGVGSYAEGWARYAESLSEEMGLYRSPYSKIGRRYWPARGMVVDPGFHVMGWSRAQAVQYMTEGSAVVDPEFLADRIAVWPGQLTAYDTGAREFFALREQARRELGAAFDLREFHDTVLQHGAVTLPMLRRIVERWVADTKSLPH